MSSSHRVQRTLKVFHTEHAMMPDKNMNQPTTAVDIKCYNENDILCGKSRKCHSHPGNVNFRDLIKELKNEYIALPKNKKRQFAELVVLKIRASQPPGRFLKQSATTGSWEELEYNQAVFKTRQALREGAPVIEEGIRRGEIKVETNFLADAMASADSQEEGSNSTPSNPRSGSTKEDSLSLECLLESTLESPQMKESRSPEASSEGEIKVQPSTGNPKDDQIEPIPLKDIMNDDSESSPGIALSNFLRNYEASRPSPPKISIRQQTPERSKFDHTQCEAREMTESQYIGQHWSPLEPPQSHIRQNEAHSIERSENPWINGENQGVNLFRDRNSTLYGSMTTMPSQTHSQSTSDFAFNDPWSNGHQRGNDGFNTNYHNLKWNSAASDEEDEIGRRAHHNR